jgi:hypothetical protein
MDEVKQAMERFRQARTYSNAQDKIKRGRDERATLLYIMAREDLINLIGRPATNDYAADLQAQEG